MNLFDGSALWYPVEPEQGLSYGIRHPLETVSLSNTAIMTPLDIAGQKAESLTDNSASQHASAADSGCNQSGFDGHDLGGREEWSNVCVQPEPRLRGDRLQRIVRLALLFMEAQRKYGCCAILIPAPVHEGSAFDQRRILLRATLPKCPDVLKPKRKDGSRSAMKPRHLIFRGVQRCHAINPCIHISTVEGRKAEHVRKYRVK